VAKVWERLAVRKKAAQKLDADRFNPKKLSELEVRNSISLRSQRGLQLWKTSM
jgi:hypothetical protein